jgi:starvation-inducible DNA-binding protein
MAADVELLKELIAMEKAMKGGQTPGEMSARVAPLAKELGVLLADTFSLYHEAHGFHWNVKGPDFAQYHDLFADIYGDLYGSIDPLAENILKLGYDAPFHLSRFVAMRTIEETDPEDTPSSMAMELLKGINSLISSLKAAFVTADDMDEQGIADFIAGRIESTQKWAWQLRASLGLQKPNRF